MKSLRTDWYANNSSVLAPVSRRMDTYATYKFDGVINP
jgi:hypothetical protein